jgi:hypothetical protein
MRTLLHYQNMLQNNPHALIGIILAASMIYAAAHGSCEPDDHNTAEWKAIARRLKATYGETLDPVAVKAEIDNV